MQGIIVGRGPYSGVLLTGQLHLLSGNFQGVLAGVQTMRLSIYWCFLLRRKNRAYGVVLLNAISKLSRMISTCLPFERSLALSWIVTVSCVSHELFFRELC